MEPSPSKSTSEPFKRAGKAGDERGCYGRLQRCGDALTLAEVSAAGSPRHTGWCLVQGLPRALLQIWTNRWNLSPDARIGRCDATVGGKWAGERSTRGWCQHGSVPHDLPVRGPGMRVRDGRAGRARAGAAASRRVSWIHPPSPPSPPFPHVPPRPPRDNPPFPALESAHSSRVLTTACAEQVLHGRGAPPGLGEAPRRVVDRPGAARAHQGGGDRRVPRILHALRRRRRRGAPLAIQEALVSIREISPLREQIPTPFRSRQPLRRGRNRTTRGLDPPRRHVNVGGVAHGRCGSTWKRSASTSSCSTR